MHHMPQTLLPRSSLTPSVPPAQHVLSFPLEATFGVCCACADTKQVHCPTPCQPAVCQEARLENVSRWYFGVSTGHAASTTFSSGACFQDDRTHTPISWQFEGSHNYGDRGHVHSRVGLKAWYEGLSSSPENVESEAMRLLHTVLLPDMAIMANGRSTVVDLGHHVNLGLLEPLHAELSPRVRFIRIIRSRFDTVRSFLYEAKVPCAAGMFSLCPLTHPDIALPMPKLTWAKLSDAQRLLWFIDEVEARWQRLRRAHPVVPHLTVNWCTGEQLTSAWRDVAAFIGEGHLSPKPCPRRVHGSYNISDEELGLQDSQYQERMAYSPSDRLLLNDVQRPNDCADRGEGTAADAAMPRSPSAKAAAPALAR